MKTFTLQKSLFTVLFIFTVIFWSPGALSQEIISRDGNQYIRIDLNQYTSFNTGMIISKLDIMPDVKFILSDEKGIAYVYPMKKSISSILDRVKGVIEEVEVLNQSYTKDQKAKVIDSLERIYGEGLGRYIKTGVRENINDSCHKSLPFCTGTIYSFPAGTGPGNGWPAQSGPNYGCLSTRPNPAWYYFLIDEPGSIAIYMYSTPQEDIDFCLWGPFTDPIMPCPMTNTNGGLTSQAIRDCSYSPLPTETANINNAQTGQYYILVITNYSNNPCWITFEQTSGTGTTDCTILPPPAASNTPLCIGEDLELSAANVNSATYHWTGPAGFVSNEQNPVIQNVTMANAGDYFLTITINGVTSDPTSTLVEIVDPPIGTLSGGGTMCQGDSVMLTLTCTGPPIYRALLSTGPGFPWVVYFETSPYNFYTDPGDSLTYNLIGIRNAACDGAHSGSAVINVNPKPQSNFSYENPCADLNTQFTDETAISGSALLASWLWNFDDLNSSNLQNPGHIYANAGNYDVSLTVTANNGCSHIVTKPLEIKPTPNVEAGNNVSIGYGTNTQLNGQASGGSGIHTYLWTPSDKVVYPDQLQTMTELLSLTTVFTLSAADTNGCQNSDDVTVTITGGPLSSLISVTNDEICVAEQTTLEAIPSGGSGDYTYTWTSTPPGFNSNQKEITVMPTVSTVYHVAVFDNFSTVNLSQSITVNTNPVVQTSDDITIPHGTNIHLTSTVTSGHPAYNYQWGPPGFVVTPTLSQTQTTNLYSSQVFNLMVTDAKGCQGSDVVSVTVSGGPLSVNPTAIDSVICRYESTQIKALPGGGSGHYDTYQWTSNPPGFSSTQPEPTVSPANTTMYIVRVFDGFNYVTDSVLVKVNQLPVIDLINENDTIINVMSPTEIGLCVFDSLSIDAGNPGAEYLWSNGSTAQSISIATSGISIDMQHYTVTVTNPLTGCKSDAEITAYFTFSNCSYGIAENSSDSRIKIYPNPSSNGVFNIELKELRGIANASVYNSYGKLIFSREIKLLGTDAFRGEFNLSNFTTGVYFLRLVNGDTVLLKQLIIQ